MDPDHPTNKYDFGESLSQIVDDSFHPLNKRYLEALRAVKQPCSHGPVTLGHNPNEIFTDEVLDSVATQERAYLMPIYDEACEDFVRKYRIYAFLGSGTYGAVFAARTTQRDKDGNFLHVAVKFTPIRTAAKGIIYHEQFGLISNEVLAQALLHDNPGVPKVYAIYAHGCTLIYVMELFGVWQNKEELENYPELVFAEDARKLVRLRACNGNELAAPQRYIPKYKKPGEMEVCKMSTLHLSTLQSMKDRGCSHDDIAHRNVIIDEKYDVKLIDWGATQVHPFEEKWYNNRFMSNHENYLRPPEWISSGRALLPSRKGRIIDDHRRNDLWRISCVMYSYLYGDYPFCVGTARKDIKDQVRHGNLKTGSDFTQDCTDAFLAMFEQNPQSRGRTEDLATLPWLSGYYLDTGHEFRNALPSPYVPRKYSHLGIGGRGPPDTVHSFGVTCYGSKIISDHNSLYRCFAEWEFRDQHRWVDIKANALIYYIRFMSGLAKDMTVEDADRQRQVYLKIAQEVQPYDIARYLEDNTLTPPLRMIRIIADSINCQVVLVTSGQPSIHIYGNVHDKQPPKVFQIHLYHDATTELFDLVMLYHSIGVDQYWSHTKPGVDLRAIQLDEDHKANLERKRGRKSDPESGSRSTTPSGSSKSFYDNIHS
ncbi:hypothetical protein GP486_004994 [Trichoglossum hirsutum]|uniref:Protein kinase domain-containing protein n=1 Tax=Trichoglossum hirsutum TaxID=265104 RepID=A0A9P8RN26_9PEZI|nr:hypothetical protein GP486_004994 [Trichoglossum hirsutum]